MNVEYEYQGTNSRAQRIVNVKILSYGTACVTYKPHE